MSNEEAITNLVRLITLFHLEIKALPDNLKCVKCKSLLKNACQMPCGCRFCRTCVDDVIAMGDQFCQGSLQECETTPLSTAVPDYRANKSVLKLAVKCPHTGCPHECSLVDIESHMRACSRKNIDCPFRELGCVQGMLPGEEMSGHLLQESRSHSEILIGTVANLENEMKSIKEENKSIKDENKLIKDEIKSMKIESESIKREKEVLSDRVRQLSEKLEREIYERRQSNERHIAMVTAVTAAVASNQDEMEPVRCDIRSIRDQFDCMKNRVESIQVAVGLEQLDDWLIEDDVAKTDWGWNNACKFSGKFGPDNAFELASANCVSGDELVIRLLMWAGPNDLLQWPFRGAVTVTVAHRDRREACSRQRLQCEFERPADNRYSTSDAFKFRHAVLKGVSIDLERGVRVSCWICPV